MPPPDDDQQRKIEIEIAVRDSMSTFLKTASQALESFNRELIKTGAAGQTSLEDVRKRFQLLEDQGKKTSGTFGNLSNVFGGISKSLLSPIGLVAVLETMRRSMDVFAVGTLQLSNFSKNIGVSVADINRASQQAARAGIEPEKASANLARMASSVKEMLSNPDSPNLAQLRRMNPVLAENVLKLVEQGKVMQAIQEIQKSYMRASGPDAEKYRLTLQGMFGGERSYWEASKDNLEGVPALWEANTEAALRYHKAQVDITTHWTNVKNQLFTGLLAGDIVQPSIPELPTTGKPQGRFFTGQGGVVAPGGAFEMFGSEMPKQPESYPSRIKRFLRSGMEGAGKLFDMSAGAAELEGGATLGDGTSGAKPISFAAESLKIEEDTNQSLHEIRDVLTRMEGRGTLTLSARQTTGVGTGGGVGGAPPMGALPGFPRGGQPGQPGQPPPPAVPFGEPILPGGGIPRGIPSALEPSSPFAGRFGGFTPVGAGPSGMFPQLGATKGFPGTAVSGGADIGAGPGSPIEGTLWAGIGASRDGGRRRHAGFDVGAPIGTPIKAEEDGVVIKSEWQGAGVGAIATIQYKSGVTAKYMHLSNWDQVKKGQPVSRGQVVGLSGTMSSPSQAHLHVEYYDAKGNRIDPAVRHGWGTTNAMGEGLRGRRTFAGIPGSFPAGTTREQAQAGAPATAALPPWPSEKPASGVGAAPSSEKGVRNIPGGFDQTGKMTWFNPAPYTYTDPATGKVWDDASARRLGEGVHASGLPITTPGIATFGQKGLGGYYEVTLPDGRVIITRKTDIGPANTVDLNGALAAQAYPRGVPGGSRISAKYLGPSLPEGVAPGIYPAGTTVASLQKTRSPAVAAAAGEGTAFSRRFGNLPPALGAEPSGAVAADTGFGEPGYHEARKALREENEAKSRAMINGSLTRGGRDAAKSAEVTGKVTFGEDKKSAFEGGETKPFIDLNLGRTAQAGQAGSVASFSNRFAYE